VYILPPRSRLGVRRTRATVSVVMPVLDEEAAIEDALGALVVQGPEEVVVVDGGSRDATLERARRLGPALAVAGVALEVVSAPRGRAVQLDAGARAATGDGLVFLHADTRLAPGALDAVRRALGAGADGGWFALALDDDGFLARAIGWLATRRARLFRVATGDMAIFCSRHAYRALGGYPALALMEDVVFSRRLARRGRAVAIPLAACTSARRWRRRGWWPTILSMWVRRAQFALGAPAARLATRYPNDR